MALTGSICRMRGASVRLKGLHAVANATPTINYLSGNAGVVICSAWVSSSSSASSYLHNKHQQQLQEQNRRVHSGCSGSSGNVRLVLKQCRRAFSTSAGGSAASGGSSASAQQTLGQVCKQEKIAHRTASSSSSSSSSSDSDFDEQDITVEYQRGLPVITVPLPSRRERCRFTLKPITNNVGDLIAMLKNEDHGIDRVIATSLDDTRIGAANTIENLLEEDFKLIVNDHCYVVRTPKQTRITGEEAQRLSDIKTLVSQLYEALNVQEHTILTEKNITIQLETLRQELMPLEEEKARLDMIAQRKSEWVSWIGMGLMSVQFGILARLTWWEYSWDIMEPVTYFVTYGTAMVAYAYFLVTKQEYVLQDFKDRQQLLTMHKKAKKAGLDLAKYNALKEQISMLERDLYKLQNPLKLHRPKDKLVERVTATASTNASPASPLASLTSTTTTR